MYSQIKNKIALISGASSGIGEAIARALYKQGATVILAARRQEKLEKLAQSLGDRATVVPTDLTDKTSINSLIKKIKDDFNQLDVLVHSAGAYTNGSSDKSKRKDTINFEKVESSEMQKVMAVNFTGTWLLTQALLKLLKESKGTIINISSQAAYRGFAGGTAYGVSKFAVRGLMTHLREELRDHVKVIDIGPGLVNTPLAKNSFTLTADQWERVLQPKDIGRAVIETLENGKPTQGKRPPTIEDEYLLTADIIA